MKNTLLSLLLVPLFFTSCNQSSTTELITVLKNNRKEYTTANHTFSGGHHYFRLKNFDWQTVTDTISHFHSLVLKDEKIIDQLNKDVSTWLQDSVFIGFSKSIKGTFLLDTTNLLLQEDSLELLIQHPATHGQPIENKMIWLPHTNHIAEINNQKIYYTIVPVNGTKISSEGKYRIVTTGDYKPDYLQNHNNTIASELQYFCDTYLTDWYILISSDDFFDDNLALKITDTTYFYYKELSTHK